MKELFEAKKLGIFAINRLLNFVLLETRLFEDLILELDVLSLLGREPEELERL